MSFLYYVANQPESKSCIRGYLFPLPVAHGHVPHPSYDATAGNSDDSYRQVTINHFVTVKLSCS